LNELPARTTIDEVIIPASNGSSSKTEKNGSKSKHVDVEEIDM
jgi:hypothetical protein